jgi:hypothetical protein
MSYGEVPSNAPDADVVTAADGVVFNSDDDADESADEKRLLVLMIFKSSIP